MKQLSCLHYFLVFVVYFKTKMNTFDLLKTLTLEKDRLQKAKEPLLIV